MFTDEVNGAPEAVMEFDSGGTSVCGVVTDNGGGSGGPKALAQVFRIDDDSVPVVARLRLGLLSGEAGGAGMAVWRESLGFFWV